MSEKIKVMEACIRAQEKRIEDLQQSLKNTQQSAREAPTSRQSWSDTTRFQLGNLTLGIQKSLEEAKLALSQLKTVDAGTKDTIFVGALFILKNIDTGELNRYFLIPKGGGDLLDIEGKKIRIISVTAPLIKAVIKKREGYQISFRDRILEIVEVQ